MQSTATGVQALHEELSALNVHLSRLSLELIRGDSALGLGDYRILVLVKRQGPLRAADIAAALQLEASWISRRTRVLAEHGYLERTIDPHDARSCPFVLTDAGRTAIERATGARIDALVHAIETWPPGDVASLTALLGHLNHDLAARTGARTAPLTGKNPA